MQGKAKSFIVGNLTRDPDLKYTPTGTAVATASVAVNTKRGETEKVSYFDVTFWGKTAETAAQYLRKGNPVHLECVMEQQRWDDDSGNKRTKVVHHVQDMLFLPKGGSKNQDEQPQEEPTPAPASQPEPQTSGATHEHFSDDDIPF